STARNAGRHLAGDPQAKLPEPAAPSWQPARTSTTRDLLAALVVQGLRLAEETDPLRKADVCNDVADHLVQSIVLASAGGDTERADKLGGLLGSVMDQGVASNLSKVETANPEDARVQEAEKV